ncbi:exonuclease domain-containing protein [Streptomyces sp. NPDC001276]|uniref:3'-5' exonuclease n=1 Tax=Streptomyces sp. NPDC001276 TaxID=3364555 RepID=UPI0036852675
MSTESTTKPAPPLAFVDTETTGLDPFQHDPWEIAVIFREGDLDTEHVFRIQPDLTNAEPKALEINRYHERTSAPNWQWHNRRNATERLYGLLNGVILIGSNPGFDAEMLAHLFGRYYDQPKPWHYRPIDIATLAAGYMWALDPELMAKDPGPISSRWLSRQVGVEPPGTDGHQALVDARWAKAVYDAVTFPTGTPAPDVRGFGPRSEYTGGAQ